ncbi:hypothetical protein B0J11DRAFT_553964 [Dendryphion nanum]|uniref:Cellulose-binding protein n=1 Tax=Dendryphion nanum TaxID=256645 RepID=A0A9P9D5T1_9PLEO|nr:hypothetical protein B0J11DRAFT_553964 [Dendryphion nanum]
MKFAISTSLILHYSIASALASTLCQPWTNNTLPRIFILTDIANEPDDTQSLVRALTHADLYNITGLVAITSFWLPNATYPDQIHTLVDGYATVRENLQSHSNGTFPTASYLHSVIKTGAITYGKQALHALAAGEPLSPGAQDLIAAIDASPEPLYVQLWGGANTLASAFWYVNSTRSISDLDAFTSKIRAYAISDQDDTGIWIRQNFPQVRYIVSRPGFNQYPNAAWIGISSTSVDLGGPNNAFISKDWIKQNIQVGPLGALYPDVLYIMEGDSPALLYTMQNGLGDPEHPNWGSWGGRYTSNPIDGDTQYGDAVDVVVGQNGQTYNTNKATIWRWREAFQSEFAARMQWTLAPNGPDGNTTHPPVVVVNGSCDTKALEFDVHVGDNIVLDATQTYSSDPNPQLNLTWFQYREPSSYQSSPNVVPSINITSPTNSQGRIARFTIPEPTDGTCVLPEDCPVLHVVLAVKDQQAKNPITRYKRVVLRVQAWKKSEKAEL